MKPSTMLSRAKHKQAYGCLMSNDELQTCAVGEILFRIDEGMEPYPGQTMFTSHQAKALTKIGVNARIRARIISLNDDYKSSFKEIASWLRKRGL